MVGTALISNHKGVKNWNFLLRSLQLLKLGRWNSCYFLSRKLKISNSAMLHVKLWPKEDNVLHKFVPPVRMNEFMNMEGVLCVNDHLVLAIISYPNTAKLKIFTQSAITRVTYHSS